MLELFAKENTWNAPEIDEEKLLADLEADRDGNQSDEILHIFRTVPYVDSVYVKYDTDNQPLTVKRFTFHDGYAWTDTDEDFFREHCVERQGCAYSGQAIDEIYHYYDKEHPEWHLRRYYTKALRVLDHIYSCMRKNTAREMLYKAGLDELAAYLDELDELELFAGKPSEIYSGLSMKVLRAVNCRDGALLVATESNRVFLKDLNMKFPEIFKRKLNDAQCRYLDMLITGDLTVGEAGRLFQSRRKDLMKIWCHSQFELFLLKEKREDKIRTLLKTLGVIDPIYEAYIKSLKSDGEDKVIRQLKFYLLNQRKEYDEKIWRSNRKRIYDWQERGKEYYVRYPQTIHDFCREAVYMHNCLLTYVEAVIQNDTTILFMRRIEDVNTPFITMEVYDNTLMQAYHRFNEDCTEEEADWIRGYCRRHGIRTDKFRFDAEIDELF